MCDRDHDRPDGAEEWDGISWDDLMAAEARVEGDEARYDAVQRACRHGWRVEGVGGITYRHTYLGRPAGGRQVVVSHDGLGTVTVQSVPR
jgi:hypothetical protein